MPTPQQVAENIDNFTVQMLTQTENKPEYWVTKLAAYKDLIAQLQAAFKVNIANLSIFNNLTFTPTAALLKIRLTKVQEALNPTDLEKEVLAKINDPKVKELFNLATDAVLTRIKLFLADNNNLEQQPKKSLATNLVKNSFLTPSPVQRTPLAPVTTTSNHPASPSVPPREVKVF